MSNGTQERAAIRVTIRPATEADARKLSIYFAQIAMEPGNNTSIRAGLFPATVSGQREQIRRYAEQPNSALFVAEMDGNVLGVIGAEGGNSPYSQHTVLLHLNVRRGYRGLGIGSALIREALHWAGEKGTIRRVELEVMTRNTGAIRLYERMGFTTEGRRHLAYMLPDEGDNVYIDTLLMALYL